MGLIGPASELRHWRHSRRSSIASRQRSEARRLLFGGGFTHFYKHHLGDYARDTGHLSWLEDMAYTRLLRNYYLRQLPIPTDLVEASRLVRAVTRREKEAVTHVLNEFFELREDGFHNARADKEIQQYQAQADTNRRIARERIVLRSVDESSTKGTPNLEPLTKNLEPEVNLKSNSLASQQKSAALHKINGEHKAKANPPADISPILTTLPLRGGGEFEVRGSFVAKLEPSYPDVDIARTVMEMRGWCLGNPSRLKTRNGIKRFITQWLQNEQEKGDA